MRLSLCAVLPVFNAESMVRSLSIEGLEIAAELAADFQVLIVDDGSTDATAEAAIELETKYPQLRVISHPARLGQRAVWESAMREQARDVLYCCRAGSLEDLRAIHDMWPFIGEHEVVTACRRPTATLGWIPRLPSRQPAEPSYDNCLLARREVIESWLRFGSSSQLMEYLARGRHSRHFVTLPERVDIKPRPSTAHIAASMKPAARDGARSRRAEFGSRRQTAIDKPNYVTQLRDFALGE